jgi:Zn-dependent protease
VPVGGGSRDDRLWSGRSRCGEVDPGDTRVSIPVRTEEEAVRTSAESLNQPGAGQRSQDRGLPGSVPLGHWHGVEVDAHWTVFVTVGLFTVVLATGTLPQAHPGDPGAAYWLTAIGTALALFVSLLAHELAHAVVARGFGVEVKRVTLWLLGGVTQLGGSSPTARADAVIAVVGPVTSLGFGLVSAVLAVWVGTSGLVGTALTWLASVSLVLAVFNLLPGAPLDGGRLLRAFLWWRYQDRDRAAERAAQSGKVLGYLLIVWGVLMAIAGEAAGLWLALVGWFILSGASAEQAAAADEHLADLVAVDVMTPVQVVAPAWWTVEQLVEHLSPGRVAVGVFPIVDLTGHTQGICALADLDTVPPTHRADTRLVALAARHVPPVIVTPDTSATEIAAQIRPRRGIAVVEDMNHPVGVVTELELGRAAHLSLLGWRTASHTP